MISPWRIALSLLIAPVLGLAAACSGNGGGAPPAATPQETIDSSVPTGDWQTVAPADVGLDAARLEEIAAVAELGKSNCLLVVRDGKIAGEWYFRGTDADSTQDVYSATKSVSSTLVGIAQDAGLLDVSASASTWIDEWAGTPAEAVTVRNLLSNDSGREWSRRTDYIQLIGAADRTAFGIGLDQSSAPGEVWAYNNAAIQTLEEVLQEATGEEVTQFAQERLFQPLGMTHSTLSTDRAGNTQTFYGLHSTCRDMARFGLMILDHGRWQGEQIVSEAWIAEATGAPSTELAADYGYLWWLNREGVLANPLAATSLADAADAGTLRGQIVPGAPEDMFWAIGLGNQLVQIDPGSNTVVVRLGTRERPQPPTFGPAEASRIVTEAVID